MEPKYKNKKFKSDSDFQEWLAKTARWIIHFEDCGQDFLTWYLAESGEVLHSAPFQAGVWNGCFVNVLKMDVGKHPELLKSNFTDEVRTINYRLTDIEVKNT